MNISEYLVTHGIGTVLWTGIVFLVLFLLMSRFAWKPILHAVKEREQSIKNALLVAEKTQAEMKQIQASNEELLRQARLERDNMLKEAKATHDHILLDAKHKAEVNAEKMLQYARMQIKAEKEVALKEMQDAVAVFALEIAEKILIDRLSADKKQQEFANRLAADLNWN
jgi:F-type H+-transporting ATPase subunit b